MPRSDDTLLYQGISSAEDILHYAYDEYMTCSVLLSEIEFYFPEDMDPKFLGHVPLVRGAYDHVVPFRTMTFSNQDYIEQVIKMASTARDLNAKIKVKPHGDHLAKFDIDLREVKDCVFRLCYYKYSTSGSAAVSLTGTSYAQYSHLILHGGQKIEISTDGILLNSMHIEIASGSYEGDPGGWIPKFLDGRKKLDYEFIPVESESKNQQKKDPPAGRIENVITYYRFHTSGTGPDDWDEEANGPWKGGYGEPGILESRRTPISIPPRPPTPGEDPDPDAPRDFHFSYFSPKNILWGYELETFTPASDPIYFYKTEVEPYWIWSWDPVEEQDPGPLLPGRIYRWEGGYIEVDWEITPVEETGGGPQWGWAGLYRWCCHLSEDEDECEGGEGEFWKEPEFDTIEFDKLYLSTRWMFTEEAINAGWAANEFTTDQPTYPFHVDGTTRGYIKYRDTPLPYDPCRGLIDGNSQFEREVLRESDVPPYSNVITQIIAQGTPRLVPWRLTIIDREDPDEEEDPDEPEELTPAQALNLIDNTYYSEDFVMPDSPRIIELHTALNAGVWGDGQTKILHPVGIVEKGLIADRETIKRYFTSPKTFELEVFSLAHALTLQGQLLGGALGLGLLPFMRSPSFGKLVKDGDGKKRERPEKITFYTMFEFVAHTTRELTALIGHSPIRMLDYGKFDSQNKPLEREAGNLSEAVSTIYAILTDLQFPIKNGYYQVTRIQDYVIMIAKYLGIPFKLVKLNFGDALGYTVEYAGAVTLPQLLESINRMIEPLTRGLFIEPRVKKAYQDGRDRLVVDDEDPDDQYPDAPAPSSDGPGGGGPSGF